MSVTFLSISQRHPSQIWARLTMASTQHPLSAYLPSNALKIGMSVCCVTETSKRSHARTHTSTDFRCGARPTWKLSRASARYTAPFGSLRRRFGARDSRPRCVLPRRDREHEPIRAERDRRVQQSESRLRDFHTFPSPCPSVPTSIHFERAPSPATVSRLQCGAPQRVHGLPVS